MSGNTWAWLKLVIRTVERVTTFKLLGVYVATNLKWAQQVDAFSSKAASRLYFLK